VGARQASALSLKLAAQIAGELAAEGFNIVSGLAKGIDAVAHKATISHGNVAVLAGGLDEIYPPDHVALAEEILAGGGLLISECPPGFVARAQDFPRRNRIISGSSLAVYVVEAAARSGSLITARLALEQDRDVFASPGHALDARAAGTNELLKQGATLVLSSTDIIRACEPARRHYEEHFALMAGTVRDSEPSGRRMQKQQMQLALPAHQTVGVSPSRPAELPNAGGDDHTRRILAMLSHAPIDIDDLVRLTHLTTKEVQTALSSLEVEGRVQRQGLRLYSLASS
jgi:DNA processing protein